MQKSTHKNGRESNSEIEMIVNGALNSGELVAGVADEHAGLPNGPIPNRDPLDEPGHRARRRRPAHCLSLAAVPTNTRPVSHSLPPSPPSLSSALCSNACVNAAPFIYCDTWESESCGESFICTSLCSNFLLFQKFELW
jgi:hypothetical protein